MEQYIQIITTIDKKETAERIAKVLVEKRLASCVQITGPIKSTYWWRGKIETEKEWLCIIKSRKDLYKKIEKTIKQIHPYEVPEILAIPITRGSKDYLMWLGNELG